MAYYEYRGYKCWYEEHGRENDPVIVIIPDEGQNAVGLFAFKEVLAPAAKDNYSTYRVILMDFLGTGKSDVPRISVGSTWQDQALQLKELFYHGQYGPAVLIAVGKGGSCTAAEFLKEAPELVDRIIADEQYKEIFGELTESLGKLTYIADSAEKRSYGEWHGYAVMCMQLLEGWTEKCPYCGNMMYRGVIRGGRGLATWTLEKLSNFSMNENTGDWFYLKEVKKPESFAEKIFAIPNESWDKRAFVCRKCGKMIADVKDLI
ncbi:MAG: alpha/beta hydrolase [Firmicutes bacterium]|nr:alpha/beta hydrolase [Bacillota bacterium]